MFCCTCGTDIDCITHISSVCVRFKNEQMESLVGCDSFLCVLLSELMAAVWINGFVNGREATGRVDSVSIYNRSNMPANQTYGREMKIKYRYINYSSTGVQSSDSKRLEQPLLTSFVQAGNINS